jgi:Na+/proline symporter
VLIPLTEKGNIIEMMPKTFNVFVVPMGGLFLIGMFLPACGQRGAVIASLAGLATSFIISYAHLFGWTPPISPGGALGHMPISFNWVLPSSLVVMFVVAMLGPLFFARPGPEQVEGLTWYSRRQRPAIPAEKIAPDVRSIE